MRGGACDFEGGDNYPGGNMLLINLLKFCLDDSDKAIKQLSTDMTYFTGLSCCLWWRQCYSLTYN